MDVFLFILLAIVSVGSVVGMIVSHNQAYNALFLAVAFTALGGLFALLDAPFIAVTQIIIYAGAIMVLFLFVIMMIHPRQPLPPVRRRWISGLAAILLVIVFFELLIVLRSFPGNSSSPSSGFGSPESLGRILFTKYLYPFEITSLLIVAAIVGAIYLARRKEKG